MEFEKELNDFSNLKLPIPEEEVEVLVVKFIESLSMEDCAEMLKMDSNVCDDFFKYVEFLGLDKVLRNISR